MPQTRDNTDKLLAYIAEKFRNDELDNDSLVQIIELCGDYLNLMTRADYARAHQKSYNGAKNFRQNVQLFGRKFVIDNA